MQADAPEQARFFGAVFGDEAGYVFISTLDHVAKAAGQRYWFDRAFAWPAQRDTILDFVRSEDARGCDVYFAVQLYGKPDARQKQLVRTCPSIWSDLDQAVPWKIEPEPSVILETSPGRYHGFWRAPAPLSPSEAEDLSRRIAYAHHGAGADLGGWDLTQVLRIPGTHNHKYNEMPLVRLLKCDPNPIPRAVLEHFPLAPGGPILDPWDDGARDESEPPVPLAFTDLFHWRQTDPEDRSSWAQRMVAILKEHGLSDRLVEAALVDHPVYTAKAAEKWGGKKAAILQDIRRCIKHWREHPLQSQVIEFPSLNGAAPKLPTSAPKVADAALADYPLQTLHELVSTTVMSDVELIEGFLWANRVTWVFAPASTGKTIFVLAALMHMAAERPFCGRAVAPGPVLLIEEDSPLTVMAEYVETIADIYEIELEGSPFWINRQQGLRITDEAGLARAKVAVDGCPSRPAVVAIDACERLTPSDRFNTREFDPLVRFLQWLVAQGITPIIIDHTKKPGGEQKKRNDTPKKPLDDLYGSVAKQQIADVMIFFAGSLKTSIRLSFEKFRGETPPSFTVTFTSDSGFSIKDQVYSPQTDAERKIMTFVAAPESPKSWTLEDLLSITGMRERTAYRALSSLVKHRLLLKTGPAKQPQYAANHALPGPFA